MVKKIAKIGKSIKMLVGGNGSRKSSSSSGDSIRSSSSINEKNNNCFDSSISSDKKMTIEESIPCLHNGVDFGNKVIIDDKDEIKDNIATEETKNQDITNYNDKCDKCDDQEQRYWKSSIDDKNEDENMNNNNHDIKHIATDTDKDDNGSVYWKENDKKIRNVSFNNIDNKKNIHANDNANNHTTLVSIMDNNTDNDMNTIKNKKIHWDNLISLFKDIISVFPARCEGFNTLIDIYNNLNSWSTRYLRGVINHHPDLSQYEILNTIKLTSDRSANPCSANLSSADLSSSANSSSANLSLSANLSNANPSSPNLPSANPSSANPSSANPSSANPSSANPSSANLSSANPSSANPSSANPSSANPSSANPSSANPSSANPSSANPSSANLSNPNLSSNGNPLSNTNHSTNCDPSSDIPSLLVKQLSTSSIANPSSANLSSANPSSANPSSANLLTRSVNTSTYISVNQNFKKFQNDSLTKASKSQTKAALLWASMNKLVYISYLCIYMSN
jgi:uncharacterized protein YjbI with pentapeptide repeats